MPRDICIVHIEDEFHQMGYLPTRMRQYVQQYLAARAGGDVYVYAQLETLAAGGEENAGWVVYEVTSPAGLDAKVRYIFIAARQVPDEVVEHICSHPYFIIDVLRPKEDRQGLHSTAEESIQSALSRGGSLEAMTIYTACQGGHLDEILLTYPEIRMIAKVNEDDLNFLISDLVVEGLRHD